MKSLVARCSACIASGASAHAVTAITRARSTRIGNFLGGSRPPKPPLRLRHTSAQAAENDEAASILRIPSESDLGAQHNQEFSQPFRMGWPRRGGDQIVIRIGLVDGDILEFSAGSRDFGADGGIS